MIVREESLEVIETPGGNWGCGLATPSRGAAETSVIRQRQLPGGSNPCHSHDREEVMVMLGGNVILTYAEERQPLAAGDIAIIPPHISHQIENQSESTAEWLLVSPAHMKYFHANGDEAMPPWAI
jgi:quercetin dioxygenase-like cupin family protein